MMKGSLLKLYMLIYRGMKNTEGEFFTSTKNQASLIHSIKQNRHNEQMEFGRLVSISSEDLTNIIPKLVRINLH